MKGCFTIALILNFLFAKAQCISVKELWWLQGKSLEQVNRFMQLRSYVSTTTQPFDNMVYVDYANNKTGSSISVGFGAKTSTVWDVYYYPLVASQCYKQVIPELILNGFHKDEETLYDGKILLAYSSPSYGISIESSHKNSTGACYRVYACAIDEYNKFLEGVRYKRKN